ncbi:MAG: OmpP1/FadL family transporter [Bacteroidota bacterium]
MKTLKYFFIIFIGVLCSFNSFAQVPLYTADAVRFSQTDGGGTARFVALGGANAALGGDISSISGNPAGLGFYNRSSWSISPVLRIGDFEAQYEGETTRNMTGNIQVPNMGMVFHNRFEEYAGSKWVSGTFGVAINQKQSFYNNINYRGTIEPDSDTGIPNDFMEYMLSPFINENGELKQYQSESEYNQDFMSNPYSDLASYIELLLIFDVEDENGNFLGYEVDRYDYDQLGSTRQSENINTYSGLTTLDLSYGANYNDKLYLGAGLNIHFLNYRQEKTFIESPNNAILNQYEIDEETIISGAGLSLTIGAIYKPINIVNVGLSYSTPTIMTMNETQDIRMQSFFADGDQFERELLNEVPAYSFMIPQKVTAGATFFLSKYGFATADVEYVDYQSARYNSSNGAFGGDSPDVGRDLKSTFNLRAGLEGRLDIFRARVGYAYFDNPFGVGFQKSRDVISGGIGILRKGFSADITYSLNRFNNPTYSPYQGSDIVESTSNISNFRLTLGKNF